MDDWKFAPIMRRAPAPTRLDWCILAAKVLAIPAAVGLAVVALVH